MRLLLAFISALVANKLMASSGYCAFEPLTVTAGFCVAIAMRALVSSGSSIKRGEQITDRRLGKL